MYLCTLYVKIKEVELITNILIEYLKHNKRIVVPKLGAFVVKQPSGIIRFTDLMRNDDGVLRSLLVAYGMSELEANGKIDRYVFEIRHAISLGERYNIANLGEFRAGENNNILFSHRSEPRVIGGNIKPPVEVLNIEKLKLGLLTNTITLSENVAKTQKAKTQSQTADSAPISSNKPDHYLRGLNYDDRKKKHDEARTDKRITPRGKVPLLIFIALIMVAGGVYATWYWLSSKLLTTKQTPTVVEELITIESDTLLIKDSLHMITTPIDTLYQESNAVIEIDNYTTNNIVTE